MKGSAARLALALAPLLAACAAARPVFKDTAAAPYRFTIGYDANDPRQCPSSIDADFRNCVPGLEPNAPGQPRDCIRAKGGQTVVFVSASGKDFELQFDPFGKTSIPSAGGSSGELTLETPSKKGAQPHTFWVKAGTCRPLDPQIIVEN